eukprot:1472867-Pyramimonas_sp.AAC.1
MSEERSTLIIIPIQAVMTETVPALTIAKQQLEQLQLSEKVVPPSQGICDVSAKVANYMEGPWNDQCIW